MLISYNWLKNYVDINMPAEKLAKVLAMAGLSVGSVEQKGGDFVLELEITSNRPDCLSYIGVAREVAALTGQKLKIPACKKILPASNLKLSAISIKVDNKKLCPRYTATIIRGVKIGESPKWLKDKIESIGLRSVNNVVDITNFCLFETGEPMHAFDMDNISGGSVVIRNAKKGEKITVIDGTERALDETMLVIADSGTPIAIAGVMGGLKTEVGMSTKNILLEAAYFDPVSIRRTSRKLALSSESSYRFERKVDMENIYYTQLRAAQLVLEAAGGKIEGYMDIGKAAVTKRTITLRPERVNKILGVEIPLSKTKKILLSLGMKQKSASKDALKLEAPEFRQDLQDEIDLIEEVARIYGYGNIPETLPCVVEKGERMPIDIIIDNKIRDILKSSGLSEVITYSLMSRKALSMAKIDDKDAAAVRNPLSAEQEVLRPSSISGMLGAIRYNINRKNSDLRLFELGKVYMKTAGGSFKERRNLTIGLTGEIQDGWIGKPRPVSFFDLKGIAETLFLSLGIDDFSVREASEGPFSAAACATIEVKGEPAGILGEIGQDVLKNFDIKDKVYILEIDIESLQKFMSLKKQFSEPLRYPSALRDMSIVVDNSVTNAAIISLITDSAGQILKKAKLIDRYRGGQIPQGKTSLTYRLEYQDVSKTLADKEVQEAHSRVVRALQENLGASLR